MLFKYSYKNPKISIVTICYNSIRFIEKTILSVINQNYPNIEYIVIDGGSTDGTKDIIEKYASKISYWCSEKDGGIYDAMNKGIEKATGEWIMFMNSGDCFASNEILKEVMATPVEDTVNVIYGDVIFEFAEYEKKVWARKIEDITFRSAFCHQSCLVKTKIQKFKPFDTNIKIAADYAFFYQLYYEKGNACFKYIPLFISKVDMTDSISRKFFHQSLKEKLKIRSVHKNIRWYKDWLSYLIKEYTMWEDIKNIIKKIIHWEDIKLRKEKSKSTK